MKKFNSVLYSLIKGKVASGTLNNILGSSLYNGLIGYKRYLDNADYDMEELLLKSLGSQALVNRGFLDFVIFNVLSDSQIVDIANGHKVQFSSPFNARENLIKKSPKFIKNALVKYLDLDPEDFENEAPIKNNNVNQTFIEPDPLKHSSLHDYQKRIKDHAIKQLLEKPKAKMLIHMPTGSGKTKTCVEAIIDFIRTRPFDEGLVLWFSHSNELCQQSYETLVKTWENKGDYPLPIFRIFGEHDPLNELLKCPKAVVFIGFQKFNSLKKSNNPQNRKIMSYLSINTQLVIIDEAHKSLAETYKSSIDFVSAMPNCRIIGLTATPGRSNDVNDINNKILADYFGGNLLTITEKDGKIISNPLEYLQEQKVLAKIVHRPINIILDNFNEEEIVKILSNKELDADNIDKIVESPVRNKVIVDEIERALQDPDKDSILVFACTANHCFLLQKLLEFQDIKSEIVLSETPSELRSKYINDFKNGNLKVLINFGVLTTGFDAPKLKTLIIARHTDSMVLYSQMIGRALRGPKNGGNEKNYVIDLVDNIAHMGNPDFMFTYWEEFWNKKYKYL